MSATKKHKRILWMLPYKVSSTRINEVTSRLRRLLRDEESNWVYIPILAELVTPNVIKTLERATDPHESVTNTRTMFEITDKILEVVTDICPAVVVLPNDMHPHLACILQSMLEDSVIAKIGRGQVTLCFHDRIVDDTPIINVVAAVK